MDISVVVPAYNCAGLIESAVESIYESQLKVAEIIIVNDGSKDDTGEAAKRLSAKYPLVRVINQENAGVSAARNRGIREATGQYLMFMDADDSLIPGSLADVNGILETSHPDMLLFGMYFDYYHRARCYRSDKVVYPDSGLMDREVWSKELVRLFRLNMLSPVWNKLIRRDLVLNNTISFREDMIEMEDYLFSMDCLACCETIYLLDKPVYRYRQAEDERGTFNRLRRIHSLSEYVQPFYDVSRLFGSQAAEIIKIADRIYFALFHEQIRFASARLIRLAAEDMLAGNHRQVIEQSNPKLYRNLKNKRYLFIWGQRMFRRIRHRAAVYVNYRRSLKSN